MKKRTRNKLLAIVTAILLAAVAIVPGLGTLKAGAATNYTPVAGGTTKFTKYLVIPSDTPKVPALSFAYSIEPGSKVDGGVGTMPICAGNDAGRVSGTPTIAGGQAAFGDSDTTTGGTPADNADTTKKYAQKAVTIDFSNVTFSEPGVYRYLVTEDTTTPANVTFDSKPVRTLDVNVVDNGNGTLVVSYVMYYGTVTSAQDKTDSRTYVDDNKTSDQTGITDGDKCDNFVNSWPAQNLYFGKKISGNQASKDKYFRFTVKIKDAPANTHIGVTGNLETTPIPENINGATEFVATDLVDGTPKTFTNPVSFTTDTNGEATAVFYLQGDQYVCLQGIPKNTKYEIAEDEYVADGYVSTATDSTKTTTAFSIGSLTFDDDVSGTLITDDVYAGFTNTKEGTIPTGVILSVAPWAIAGVVILAGVVFFAIRSRKKYEEE